MCRQWRSQDLILGGGKKITCEGAERARGGGGGCGRGVSPVSPLPQ